MLSFVWIFYFEVYYIIDWGMSMLKWKHIIKLSLPAASFLERMVLLPAESKLVLVLC